MKMSGCSTKTGKVKDVDLYSASHVHDTSNVHFVTETVPPGRFLGHSTAYKQPYTVTQQPASGNASQQ